MLGQLTFGHLHMLLAFSVPLAIYLTARCIERTLNTNKFRLLLALVLIAQFLLSIEIFATMTMFGGMAWLLAWASSTPDMKKRLLAILKSILWVYSVVLITVSPYVFCFFAFGFRDKPLWDPSWYAADLLNFVIPTQTNQFGRISLIKSVSARFPGSIADSGAYLGVPLLAITAFYLWRYWREPWTKVLTYCFILTALFSLGPTLHVAGHSLRIALPWWPLVSLPAIDQALPVRCSMYSSLVIALVVSGWISCAELASWVRIASALAIVLFALPNLSYAFWIRPIDTPAFFADGLYRHDLRQGETILLLPYGAVGNALLWQAQAEMYFNMAEGGAGARSEEFGRWPIFSAFANRSYIPQPGRQLKMFLAAHKVRTVIVSDQDLALWQPLLSTLDAAPTAVGGIWLYRVPSYADDYTEAAFLKMRAQFDIERLRMLVSIANRYLLNGGQIDSLTMVKARDLNLIPTDSLIGPDLAFDPVEAPHPKPFTDPRFAYGLWLSSWSSDRIALGEYVWYPAAGPMIKTVRSLGGEIYYPFPNKDSSNPQLHRDNNGFLLLILNREQLARANELLTTLTKNAGPTLFQHLQD